MRPFVEVGLAELYSPALGMSDDGAAETRSYYQRTIRTKIAHRLNYARVLSGHRVGAQN